MRVLFTTYEQFRENKEKLFDELVSFYGADTRHIDKQAAFAHNDKIDYHLRRGETEEWRRVLSSQTVDTLNRSIPGHWFSKFGWKA